MKDYFIESESFRRFKSLSKTVLLGNRGTGKSAIFKILGEEFKKKGFIVIEISPDDYSYEMLEKVLKKERITGLL